MDNKITRVNHEVTAAADESALAQEISNQYAATCKACSGAVIEMVRFGALLIEAEAKLAGSDDDVRAGKAWRRGQGLKAWLAAHCPEVNYRTAWGYKQAAMGIRDALQIAQDVPLLPLMGESPLPDKAEENLRERVLSAIQTNTLSMLRSAYAPDGRGGTREGAGRKPGSASDTVAPLDEDPDVQASLGKELVNKLYNWAITADGLSKVETDTLASLLTDIDEISVSAHRLLANRKKVER